mmetsp:Transcript_40782/g.97226  ORF Transcript_40782/g.97226 Transcript_40782/m.97226 type:complete len:227 (+) Transcript_40782:748-1428(+)
MERLDGVVFFRLRHCLIAGFVHFLHFGSGFPRWRCRSGDAFRCRRRRLQLPDYLCLSDVRLALATLRWRGAGLRPKSQHGLDSQGTQFPPLFRRLRLRLRSRLRRLDQDRSFAGLTRIRQLRGSRSWKLWKRNVAILHPKRSALKQSLLARGCNDVPLVHGRLGGISGQGEVVLRICLLVYLDLHLLAIARLGFCLQDLFPDFWLLSLLRTFFIGLCFRKYGGHDC